MAARRRVRAGSRSKNPRVPRTAVEKEAYARAQLGADFDRYSWTYNLADPGGKPGTTVTAAPQPPPAATTTTP